MPSKNCNEHREELKALPTEQLDDMLLSQLQDEDGDPDEVRLILEVLQDREKDMPEEVSEAEQLAWEKYKARVEADYKRTVKKTNWMLRAASLAVVLSVLLAAVAYDAGAEGIWGRIVRWTDSVIEFFSPESTGSTQQEYLFQTDHPGLQQVYDTVTRLGVTEPIVPMWIPEGYTLVRCKEINNDIKTTLMVALQNNEKVINYNLDIYSEDIPSKYQKDENTVEIVEIENVNYYITKNNNMWVAVWAIDNIECSISVDCQEREFYNIIQSIYGKEVTA